MNGAPALDRALGAWSSALGPENVIADVVALDRVSSATFAFGSCPSQRCLSTSVMPRAGPAVVSTATSASTVVTSSGRTSVATASASCTETPRTCSNTASTHQKQPPARVIVSIVALATAALTHSAVMAADATTSGTTSTDCPI